MNKPSSLNISEIKWLVIVMFALAWVSMKLSLPTLPSLIKAFHSTPSTIKFSVSLFLLCYSLSQLFWASFSEKFGRKKVITCGLITTMVGTIIVILSTHVSVYLVGRSLEGVGVGMISPLGRAILSDVFERNEITKLFTIVGSINGLMPAIAPIVGGFILAGFGWRAVFVFFLIVMVSYSIWNYFCLPETHKNPVNQSSWLSVFFSYKEILKNSTFWGYNLGYSITQGLLLGYYAAMPFWFVEQWHMKEQYYTFLAIFSVGSYFLGLTLTRYWSKNILLEKLLRWALIASLAIAVFSLILAFNHVQNVSSLVIIMSLFAFIPAITFPTANSILVHHFKSQSSMVSALSGALMFFASSLFSYIESHLNVRNLWQLSYLLLVSSVVSLLFYEILTPKRHSEYENKQSS